MVPDPFGFTVPFSTALSCLTLEAEPVVTAGEAAASATPVHAALIATTVMAISQRFIDTSSEVSSLRYTGRGGESCGGGGGRGRGRLPLHGWDRGPWAPADELDELGQVVIAGTGCSGICAGPAPWAR